MTTIPDDVPPAEAGGRGTPPRAFLVRAENVPGLRERIDRIDRRARRLGTGPVLLVDTGRREAGRAVVILQGEAPQLEGWRIAAIVRHRGADAELRPVPGAPAVTLSW